MKHSTPTLGVIYGNRDFFPDHLVTEARSDIAKLTRKLGIRSVELVNTSVARDIRTVNGRVRLADRSVVAGDLVVVKKRGNKRRRPLEIELEGGSVIEGDLIVEDPTIEVRVLVSGGSEIRGRVENAEVVKRDI